MGAATLRDLVLMMREHQIQPPGMNVERLAEIVARHGRALDMPARPSRRVGKGIFPSRLIFAARLPENEIGRIALVRCDLDACTGDHVLPASSGQGAVCRHFRDTEKHMAFGGIGETTVDQCLDHVDHATNELGRPRLMIRRQRAKRGNILVKTGNGVLAQPVDAD